MLLIISLKTIDLSSSMSSNIIWILSWFYVIFTSQSIMISSLFAYAYHPWFHIPYGVMIYISYVTSSSISYGLDFRKYENTPCRNKVMRMSKLVKYMLWSSTYGSMAWSFAMSLTTRPDSIMMNNIMSLLWIIGTDKELLNMSMYRFSVYCHVYWTSVCNINTFPIAW